MLIGEQTVTFPLSEKKKIKIEMKSEHNFCYLTLWNINVEHSKHDTMLIPCICFIFIP